MTTTKIGTTFVTLSWGTASGTVSMYMVYRNGVNIAGPSSTERSYNDTGLTPSTTYSYGVSAMNTAEGTKSTISVTTAVGMYFTTPERTTIIECYYVLFM